MATIEQFLDHVILYAPDIDEGIAQFAIQESITDFMIDTEVARDFLRIPLHDHVNDYALDLDMCRVLVSIKNVKKISSDCDTRHEELEDTKVPTTYGYAFDTDNGASDAIWIGDVSNGGVIEVEYAWAIGRESCVIPDFILNKYVTIIQYLALSKIYMIPGQDWTSPQVASNYKAMYDNEVKKLKRKTRKVSGGEMIGGGFIRKRGSCLGGFFK